MLWPILITFSLGLAALGIYIEKTTHEDLLAGVDDELARIERAFLAPPPFGEPGQVSAAPFASTEANVTPPPIESEPNEQTQTSQVSGFGPLGLDTQRSQPEASSTTAGFGPLSLDSQGVALSEQTDTDEDVGQGFGPLGLESTSQPVAPLGLAAPSGQFVADAPIHFIVGSDGQVKREFFGSQPFDATMLSELISEKGLKTVDKPARYRVKVSGALGSDTMISALPLDQVDASVSSLRSRLLFGGLVIFALECFVVWLIATMVTKPVANMTEAANKIAGGALDTPIKTSSGSRETIELAGDLEDMLAQLRTTLDESEQSANEATRARDDMQRFLADASHELRTPLTALKGYSDLYVKNILRKPVELDRAMRRIGSESERLCQLVTNMLDLARHGKADDISFDRVDMVQIVLGVADDLRAAYPDQCLDVAISARSAHVLGDASRLHQAILNLGANACQHSATGTDICLGLTTSETDVIVSVIDHGPGIDAEYGDKIFLPFYRITTSRIRRGAGRGGAGLGLSLTKQVAEQHDADITLVPTLGGGATFKLTVPLYTQKHDHDDIFLTSEDLVPSKVHADV